MSLGVSSDLQSEHWHVEFIVLVLLLTCGPYLPDLTILKTFTNASYY